MHGCPVRLHLHVSFQDKSYNLHILSSNSTTKGFFSLSQKAWQSYEVKKPSKSKHPTDPTTPKHAGPLRWFPEFFVERPGLEPFQPFEGDWDPINTKVYMGLIRKPPPCRVPQTLGPRCNTPNLSQVYLHIPRIKMKHGRVGFCANSG